MFSPLRSLYCLWVWLQMFSAGLLLWEKKKSHFLSYVCLDRKNVFIKLMPVCNFIYGLHLQQTSGQTGRYVCSTFRLHTWLTLLLFQSTLLPLFGIDDWTNFTRTFSCGHLLWVCAAVRAASGCGGVGGQCEWIILWVLGVIYWEKEQISVGPLTEPQFFCWCRWP